MNLSDLAAKGAVPAGFVLTLALRSKEDAWLRPFADALGEDAKSFACPLLGGDTVSTPGPQMISITAFGRVPRGRMVGRTGAKPGDRILVTGTIGDAALGLDVLTGGAVAGALASDPTARDVLGRVAIAFRSRAMRWRRPCAIMRRRCNGRLRWARRRSNQTLRGFGRLGHVDVAHIFRSRPAAGLRSQCRPPRNAVSGGDDYEVLCAVPAAQSVAPITAGGRAVGIAVTAVGTIIEGNGRPRFLDGKGRELALKRLSYSHF